MKVMEVLQIPRCRSTKILHHEDFAARHTRSQCPGVETYRKFQLIRILRLCGHSHHQNTAMWNPASSSLTRFDRFAQLLVSYYIFLILFARRYRRDFVLHQIPQLAFPQGMDSDTAAYAMPTHVVSSVLCLEAEKGAARKRTSHMAMAWNSGNRHRHSLLYMYIIILYYIYIWIEHLFDIQHMSEEGKKHVRGSHSFTS